MGIGIKELRTLYNKITEIATENNILPKIAMDKLLDDLKDYDYILRFKNTLEKMEQELSHLNIEIEQQRRIISAQSHIGALLQSLLGMGLTEKDILEINSILLRGGFDFDQYNNNNNNINKQSLLSDLTEYQNIKLVTNQLELKNNKLSKTIVEIENQKKIIENYVNLLLIIIYNLEDLQLLFKKVNILLEKPKIILIINLFYNSFLKGTKEKLQKYNDSSKDKNHKHKDKKRKRQKS
jgi:hypothetical protein